MVRNGLEGAALGSLRSAAPARHRERSGEAGGLEDRPKGLEERTFGP